MQKAKARQTSHSIDRNDIIDYIKEQIKNSPRREFEVSATDLAKVFGIQGPSMDYHLKRFLSEGTFVASKKKGKFGRKIFLLPEDNKPQTVVNNMEEFADLIKSQIDVEKLAEQVKHDDDIPTEENTENQTNDVEQTPETQQPQQTEEPVEVIAPANLTLNDRIEKFLAESNSVPDASQLISKSDKEVLSVMAESIQQQQVYLKDLSHQLELMENLKLLHSLIDERNRMTEEVNQMREEHNALLATMSKNEEQVSVDPQRVRLMHQIIINTLDTYLELPNHALALQRKEFRNNIAKEISDLANYILGIEK